MPRLASWTGLALAFLLAAGAAEAQLHRWTDAQGKVHYSDRAPTGQATTAVETIDTQRSAGSASELDKSRPIGFSKLVDELGDSRAGLGRSCSSRRDFARSDLARYWKRLKFGEHLYAWLEERGFRTPLADELEFERARPEILLIAVVEELHFGDCGYDTLATVRWRVLDAHSGEVVYDQALPGRSKRKRGGLAQRDVTESLRSVLLASAGQLVGKREFLAAVSSQAAPASPAPSDLARIGIRHGDGRGDVTAAIAELSDAIVTIRAGSQDTTGFFISREGHVLTHHAAIANDAAFRVVVGSRLMRARVVSRSAARAVALLQVEDVGPTKAFALSRRLPTEGQPLYVVGGLHGAMGQGSVTRGILSAQRRLGGSVYYQTDAALGSVSAGGPVLDARGDVVAIAASGMTTAKGEGLGLNLLIPIESALEALGVATD